MNCKHPLPVLEILGLPNAITTLLMIMPKQATTLAEKRQLLVLHC
jgi:hypothetical protein